MITLSTQFHACNAWIYAYDKPRMHWLFYSYKTEICISSYHEENGRKVMLLWLRPDATHISRSTTTQMCRYLGERIQPYVSYAKKYGTKPYMPVAHVRMMQATGMIGDSTGVYARVVGSLREYTDEALECAVDGR